MAKRVSDLDIATRVVPTMLRWPPSDVAKTIAWDRLREAVELLRALVRGVDSGCITVEQDSDLSPDGIARRVQALGRQAISELENWPPLQAAERAVARDVEHLEKRMTDLPTPPTSVADVALAQEIRQFVRSQKSPIDVAMKSASDPRILGAILSAPSFLSGVSDAELTVLRERARTALHPEQVQMQRSLTKALDDVREGLAATKRMLQERCKMAPDNSIREPLPGGALAAAKTAAA